MVVCGYMVYYVCCKKEIVCCAVQTKRVCCKVEQTISNIGVWLYGVLDIVQ